MHAMIVTVNFDPARRAEQVSTLRERVVPSVRQSQGFVAGYWSFDEKTAKGHSFVVFETEDAAKRMIEAMKSNLAGPNAGVSLEFVTTAQIEAEARVQ